MATASCTRTCWIAGAGLGVLVWLITAGIGPLAWFEGLFLGLVAAGLGGVFLVWLLCGGEPAMDSAAWHPKVHATSPQDDMQLRPRGVASEGAKGFLGAAESDAMHPVAPSGDAQAPTGPTERAGATRNDIYGSEAAAATPDMPTPMDEGAPDDLKEIKGVGPKLEEFLHENGVTRFDQIAAWDEAEIDHFAELIGRMGGRIRSDDWVGQARVLAAGGETEFSQRVEEGGVY